MVKKYVSWVGMDDFDRLGGFLPLVDEGGKVEVRGGSRWP
jgi:hypothetical protein